MGSLPGIGGMLAIGEMRDRDTSCGPTAGIGRRPRRHDGIGNHAPHAQLEAIFLNSLNGQFIGGCAEPMEFSTEVPQLGGGRDSALERQR
jgi:hypothetical protein